MPAAAAPCAGGRRVREIAASDITDAVARMAVEATHFLPEDVEGAIRAARDTERSPLGVQIIDEILENAEVARTRMLPLCQDTGTAVVHVELGQDVHVAGGYLIDAINEGIRRGYGEGYLRKSIAGHPSAAARTPATTRPASSTPRSFPANRSASCSCPRAAAARTCRATRTSCRAWAKRPSSTSSAKRSTCPAAIPARHSSSALASAARPKRR